MKNRKGIALIISLVLIVAVVLPGTLALSTDQTSSDGTITVSTETTTPVPDTTETPTPDGTEAPTMTPTEEPAKTCTCGAAEGEAHKEGCPLYVAPEKPAEEPKTEAKTCTCAPAPAEGEAHKEGCPLYVAPEKPVAPTHIDTCTDGCTDAECKCACHLFSKIMACTTLDEIWGLLDAASEDALNALTDEQNAQIDARIEALEPAPAPAIVIEESEPPVPSEVDYAMINYTNVAPLGDPITGQHQ